MSDKFEVTDKASTTAGDALPSRRRLLKIGAIAAPAVITLRPGFAWAASVSNCLIKAPYLVKDNNGVITAVPSDTGPFPTGTSASNLVATTNAVSTDGVSVTYFGAQVPSASTNRAPADYISYFQTQLQTTSTLPGISCLNSLFPTGTIN